jgi:hypothetical protein
MAPDEIVTGTALSGINVMAAAGRDNSPPAQKPANILPEFTSSGARRRRFRQKRVKRFSTVRSAQFLATGLVPKKA